MPIQLDCPRCKKPLSVPSRKAGTYVNCPQCKGQFWVPDAVDQAAAASATPREEAANSPVAAPPPGIGSAPGGKNVAKFLIPPPSDSPGTTLAAPESSPTGGASPFDRVVPVAASGPVPVAAPPGAARGSAPGVAWSPVTPPVEPAVLPAGAPRVPEPARREKAPAGQSGLPAKGPAGAVRSAVTPPGKSAPPAGPPLPAPPPTAALSPSDRRDKPPQAAPKVARFITTEAAQSSLKLAEDGKLPELHLREPGDAVPKEQTSKGTNPLVLFGLLCLSMVMTLVMVMVPTEPGGSVSSQEREKARQTIEREYFRDMDSPQPRKDYQVALREAQQAHSRGDFKRERELYRDVLRKLRAERGPFDPGLTGSQASDEKLRGLIETLLASGG